MTDVAAKRFRHCERSAANHAGIPVVLVDCRVAEAPRNDGSGRQMLSSLRAQRGNPCWYTCGACGLPRR